MYQAPSVVVGRLRLFCTAVAFAFVLAEGAAAAILVNDQFADNERSTQSPPSSLAWTVGAHNSTDANAFGTLNASGGNLVLDHTNAGNNSFAAVLAYFTTSGSPLTLAVDDRLTLTFDVSFSSGGFTSSTGAFRWALFNSGGSRVSADFAGANATGISSGSTFNGYRGYEGQTIVNSSVQTSTTPDLLTRERTGTGSGLFTSSEWTSQSGSAVIEPLITAGTTHAGSLVLTRTSSGVDVQASLAGATTNLFSDNTSPVTSFDTIAFFTLDSLTHDLTFDNIQLVTDVVPEPSALALCGLAAAGLAARRRRR